MRGIIYPAFLLALVGGAYYFFGENLSPFMQKVLLVLAIAFAFFTFRGIFLLFFGWMMGGLSSLLKTLIAGVLFLLSAWGIWNILPEDTTDSIQSVFTADTGIIKNASTLTQKGLDAAGNTIGNATNKISEGVDTAGSAISDTAHSTTDHVINGANVAGGEISDTANAAVNGIKNGVVETGATLNKIGRTPRHLLKNIARENTTPTKNTETKNTEISDHQNNESHSDSYLDSNSNEASKWKKPVIAYTTTSENTSDNTKDTSEKSTNTQSENSAIDTEKTASDTEKSSQETKSNTVKTKISVENMKEQGVRLISSGERAEDYTVSFRTEDAKIVFPVEYKVLNAIWTDTDNTIDQVDFIVQTPDDISAQISISLFDKGETYEKFLKIFEPANDGENKFYIAEKSKNSIRYVSFFEGILWEISIQREGENLTENDFYNILLPMKFEKRD